MNIKSIKTGDIFYYDDYTPHNGKTHRHRCRVLFVGSENIFYDVWWDSLDKWAFVPTKKNLSYYRFPLTLIHKLIFEGFEPIDEKNTNKLFLESPEVLLNSTKNEFSMIQSDNKIIEVYSDTIAYIPIGPKGGVLKSVLFDSKQLTKSSLIKMILENQNLDFIQTNEIILHRGGLHSGIPSYIIRTY